MGRPPWTVDDGSDERQCLQTENLMSKRIDMLNRKKNLPLPIRAQEEMDEANKHLEWLIDKNLRGVATMNWQAKPYIMIMMNAETWALEGKRFVFKKQA